MVDTQTSTKRAGRALQRGARRGPRHAHLRQRPGDGARRPVVDARRELHPVDDRDRHEFLLHVAGRARQRRHGAGGRHERRVGVRRRRRLELRLRLRERAGGPGDRRGRHGRESTAAGRRSTSFPRPAATTFSGTAFFSTAGKWSQGSNLDDDLRRVGITEPPGLIKNWDTNLAIGGPIKRDRLWFFNNLRTYGTHQDIPGLYANANALDASKWDYVKDPNVKARSAGAKKIEAIRLTGQLTPKNKVGFYWEYQANCAGSALVNTGDRVPRPRRRLDRARHLDDVARVRQHVAGAGKDHAGDVDVADDEPPAVRGRLLVVQQQVGRIRSARVADGSRRRHRAEHGGRRPRPELHVPWLVLGRVQQSAAQHLAGVGVLRDRRPQLQGRLPGGLRGVPADPERRQPAGLHVQQRRRRSQFTMRIGPHIQSNRTRYDGFYAQDQWTRGRLTLQGALRYEHAWSWFPEGENGITADNQFGSRFIFPRAGGRHRLPRHHAAHGRGVRSCSETARRP